MSAEVCDKLIGDGFADVDIFLKRLDEIPPHAVAFLDIVVERDITYTHQGIHAAGEHFFGGVIVPLRRVGGAILQVVDGGPQTVHGGGLQLFLMVEKVHSYLEEIIFLFFFVGEFFDDIIDVIDSHHGRLSLGFFLIAVAYEVIHTESESDTDSCSQNACEKISPPRVSFFRFHVHSVEFDSSLLQRAKVLY